MAIYKGIGVSAGVVMGKALTIYSAFHNFPRYQVDTEEKIGEELRRVKEAQETADEQLNQVLDKSSDILPDEIRSVFVGYKMFIYDKRFIPAIEQNIKEKKINAEWALINVIAELEEQFQKIPDPYIRARFEDVRQLGERIMNNLQQKPHLNLTNIQEPVILVANDISPADAFHLDRKNILGIVTELGSSTSHLAILSRAMNIPAIVGVPDITSRLTDYDIVVLDGNSGEVIDRPTDEEINEKLSKKERLAFYQKQLLKLEKADCELSDGNKVELAANLDYMEEIPQINSLNVSQIGLIRTEFLCLYEGGFPNEEQQFEIYRKIVEGAKGKPITVRTWDIGGDKTSNVFPELLNESNPALGLRAIRICLKHSDFFRSQIKAVVRAAKDSPVKLMVPMITRLDEIFKVHEMIKEEVFNYRVPPDNVSLGCMIETPAAVFLIDEILDLVDFVSIGSNDLIQYTLAIDRMNENVADLYAPYHPSILKMMERIISSANRVNKPVSICGEIAADPIMQMFLIGTGKITLSMSPNYILRTKRILQQVDSITCKNIAFQLVSKHSVVESNLLVKELRDKYLEEFEK